MSRSVPTHPNSIATVFLAPDWDDELWLTLIEDLRNILTGEAGVDSGLLLNEKPFTGFDGYNDASRWVSREDKVILEGELTEISVSEYLGVVSVCLAPLDPDEPSHRHACEHAAPYFNALLKAAYPDTFLRKVGTFSNGESVYERNQAA